MYCSLDIDDSGIIHLINLAFLWIQVNARLSGKKKKKGNKALSKDYMNLI